MPTSSSDLIGASRLNWNEWDYRKACIKINQTWGVQARNKYCPQWVKGLTRYMRKTKTISTASCLLEAI